MLDRITAVRFDRPIKTGKTRPCQLVGQRTDGEEIEVIAKFSAGCERHVGGLVAEAIAGMLAADLDLPVPEPFLVSFDEGFVDLVQMTEPDLVSLLRSSAPVAFGSANLPPGFITLPLEKAIPSSLRQQALEIFAFDVLIQNPDRRPVNPNCLSNGNELAIFDHELAFMIEGIIGWCPPWEPGGLRGFDGPGNHVFFSGILGGSHDLGRFLGAWKALNDDRFKEYELALPPEWNTADGVVEKTMDYITQIRENIDQALAEIVRVLA